MPQECFVAYLHVNCKLFFVFSRHTYHFSAGIFILFAASLVSQKSKTCAIWMHSKPQQQQRNPRGAPVTDCCRFGVAAGCRRTQDTLSCRKCRRCRQTSSLAGKYTHRTYITCQSNFIFTPEQVGNRGLRRANNSIWPGFQRFRHGPPCSNVF